MSDDKGIADMSSTASLVSALSAAAEAITEVASMAKDSAVIADTAKRARASIIEEPRSLLWLILGAIGLGIVVGFLFGRRGRNGFAEADFAPPVAEPSQAAR